MSLLFFFFCWNSLITMPHFFMCIYLFIYFCCFKFIYFALEYNCFTILCYFLLYNEVNRLYVYPLLLDLPIPLLPSPHPKPGHRRALSWAPVLSSRLPLAIHFTHGWFDIQYFESDFSEHGLFEIPPRCYACHYFVSFHLQSSIPWSSQFISSPVEIHFRCF